MTDSVFFDQRRALKCSLDCQPVIDLSIDKKYRPMVQGGY